MTRGTRIWRRVERLLLGAVMVVAARILERRLIGAVRDKPRIG